MSNPWLKRHEARHHATKVTESRLGQTVVVVVTVNNSIEFGRPTSVTMAPLQIWNVGTKEGTNYDYKVGR